MKIVIASDSYKESLSSLEVAHEIKKAFKKVLPEAKYETVCLADGGEGTVEALVESCKGSFKNVRAYDALGREIKTFYGVIDKGETAVIEMANVVGLQQLKEKEKDPLKTSSYGFGQLIENARKNGFKKMVLGLGGSATNDAGIGMLQAMGVKFLNKENIVFKATINTLHKIEAIDDTAFQKKYAEIQFDIACDVTNPLCGKEGASFVFGTQKGASKKELVFLDNQLQAFARMCEKHFNKSTQCDKGSGAAGGVGFALNTFLNVSMRSGIDMVIDKSQLNKKIKNASLVITGEGRVDAQTVYGKTIVGVASLAKKNSVPVIVIAGCTKKGYEAIYDKGVTAVFDITPMNLSNEELFANTKVNLYNTSKNIATLLNLKLIK